jgi:hypothetical protein
MIIFLYNVIFVDIYSILELCYLETLIKIRLKIFAIKCRHSLRTVGDSLKGHNSPLFLYLSVIEAAVQEKVGWVLPDISTNTSRICYYIGSK